MGVQWAEEPEEEAEEEAEEEGKMTPVRKSKQLDPAIRQAHISSWMI